MTQINYKLEVRIIAEADGWNFSNNDIKETDRLVKWNSKNDSNDVLYINKQDTELITGPTNNRIAFSWKTSEIVKEFQLLRNKIAKIIRENSHN